MIRRGGPCRSRPAIAGEPGHYLRIQQSPTRGGARYPPAAVPYPPYGTTCRNPLPDKEVGGIRPPEIPLFRGNGYHINHVVFIAICPATYANRYGRCHRRGTPRTTLLSRHGSAVCGRGGAGRSPRRGYACACCCSVRGVRSGGCRRRAQTLELRVSAVRRLRGAVQADLEDAAAAKGQVIGEDVAAG